MSTDNVVDLTAIASLISFFVPVVVALITKDSASPALKALVNAVGVAVVAVLTLWINPTDLDITWQVCVNTFLASLVVSAGAYFMLLKPLDVTGSLSRSTAGFGIGGKNNYDTAA